MDIKKLLTDVGLTETEIQVYLSGLSLGPTRATAIAEHTGLKRPRIYHALETLEEKGLVGKRPSKGTTTFIAEQPEQILSVLKRKQIDIDALSKKVQNSISLFPTFDNQTLGFPHIQYFKGMEGAKTIAERVYVNTNDEILGLNPPFKYIEDEIPSEYFMAYLDKRAKLGIKVRSIWQDQPVVSEFANHERFGREIRMAPVEKFGEFRCIISIVGNNVIMLSVQPEVFGLLITSSTVAQTMRNMWNTLWEASTPLDEYEAS